MAVVDKTDHDNISAILAQGLRCHREGDLQRAAALYRRVLVAEPTHFPAMNNLGVILLETGDPGGAADLFRRAVAADPGFVEAYANLSLALERQGDPESGARVLEQLLALRPDDGQGWRQLGLMRFQRGDLAGASEALWKGLAIDPDMDGADTILLVLLQAALHGGQCSSAAPDRWIHRLRELAPESHLPDLLSHGLESLAPETAQSSWQKAADRLARLDDDFSLPAHRIGPPVPGPQRWAVLLNFGRSGTGFLHSLLDSHPRVSTLPGIYLKDFFGQGNWREIRDPNPSRAASRFCQHYEVLFDARTRKNVPGNNHPAHFPIGVSEGFTRMGEDGSRHLTLDRRLFETRLAALLACLPAVDAYSFFRCVHAAFDDALGRPVTPDLGFYHIHNPDHFSFIDFLRRTPGCRILTMVRHPLQSLESWISKSMDEPGAYPEIVNKVVRMIFGVNRTEFSLFPSAGLRLEDLKARPDETLSRLCRFLDIPVDPSLRRSTMQGLRWWGEPGSVRLEKKDPFGQQPDDPTDRRVGSVLSGSDQLILRTLFYPFSVRFGYVAEDREGFLRDLGRIRPLLDHPFDFERRYAAVFPRSLLALEQNLHCAYLRRLLALRWETLMRCGNFPGLLDPL